MVRVKEWRGDEGRVCRNGDSVMSDEAVRENCCD